MTNILKPSDINKVWADTGDKVSPSDTKIAAGYGVEIPTLQHFNWLENKQDQAIAHINQHGIPVWDIVTTYEPLKSYVQGSDGNIYSCHTFSGGVNPVSDTANVNWYKVLDVKGNGTPQVPTLLNSWTGSDGLGYRFFNGCVQFYGRIAGGTRLDATTLFTLPVGYRPSILRRLCLVNLAPTQPPAYVIVSTSGTVSIYNAGSTGDLSFDSIMPL